ncbi:hypothetical protein ABTW96_27790 [Nocardia beijingensis]|uniref:hypothetical protein n=1 Tax=Nocardia beijingensis TaxID=95162 RepID=UPI00331DA039
MRFHIMWGQIGEQLPWVKQQGITCHWLRHTTLTWVERNFGHAVAKAYAGHADNHSDGATSIVRARFVVSARHGIVLDALPSASGRASSGSCGGMRVLEPNAVVQPAQMHWKACCTVATWSSLRLRAVIVVGLVWSAVNVGRNLASEGGPAGASWWLLWLLSFGIEAMTASPPESRKAVRLPTNSLCSNACRVRLRAWLESRAGGAARHCPRGWKRRPH